MSRIIVVGAGIVGASVAYRLTEAGHEVLVLERDHPAAGTSGTSFAWTNANEKTPESYHTINRLGMRAHLALENEFGSRPWYHGGGAVEWRVDAAEAAELGERVARLQGWRYDAQWISRRDLQDLEPSLAPQAARDVDIAYFPTEGWVDPAIYIAFFLERARRLGARLQRGAVAGLVVERDGVRGVRTAAGETIGADLVINCTGRWARDLTDDDRLRFPLAPTIGLLVIARPSASGVRRIIRTSGCNFRPDGAGRLMLQSEHDEAPLHLDSRPEETGPVARTMIARAAALYPDLEGVAPEAMKLALRAIPGDGLSAIGPIPGFSGYYAAVTHSGATLAPWIGRSIAREVAGESVAELDDFRPARFFA